MTRSPVRPIYEYAVGDFVDVQQPGYGPDGHSGAHTVVGKIGPCDYKLVRGKQCGPYDSADYDVIIHAQRLVALPV